jgi:hypothetical protein
MGGKSDDERIAAQVIEMIPPRCKNEDNKEEDSDIDNNNNNNNSHNGGDDEELVEAKKNVEEILQTRIQTQIEAEDEVLSHHADKFKQLLISSSTSSSSSPPSSMINNNDDYWAGSPVSADDDVVYELWRLSNNPKRSEASSINVPGNVDDNNSNNNNNLAIEQLEEGNNMIDDPLPALPLMIRSKVIEGTFDKKRAAQVIKEVSGSPDPEVAEAKFIHQCFVASSFVSVALIFREHNNKNECNNTAYKEKLSDFLLRGSFLLFAILICYNAYNALWPFIEPRSVVMQAAIKQQCYALKKLLVVVDEEPTSTTATAAAAQDPPATSTAAAEQDDLALLGVERMMMMEIDKTTTIITAEKAVVAQIAATLKAWLSLFLCVAGIGVLYVEIFMCLDEVEFKVFAGLVSVFFFVLYLRIDILSRAIWKNKWCNM